MFCRPDFRNSPKTNSYLISRRLPTKTSLSLGTGVLAALALSATASAAPVLPASSLAERGAVERAANNPRKVAPGQVVRLAFDIERVESCSLSTDDGVVSFVPTRPGDDTLTARFRVARDAAPGVYAVSADCYPAPRLATVRVRVSAPPKTSRARAARATSPYLTGSMDGYTTASPEAATIASPTAPENISLPGLTDEGRAAGSAAFSALLARTNNLSGWDNGQCTGYAFRQRPDAVQAVITAYFAAKAQGLSDPDGAGLRWDARNWDDKARSVGLVVGDIARVGSIVVMEPGFHGVGEFGHVGIVRYVAPDGAFAVESMNVGGPWKMATIRYPAADLASPLLSFIY